MLTISNLDYRVEARALFEGASAQISDGWKVGLVGRNGTGKSTLLRLIREEIANPAADSAIRMSARASLGWVAQEVAPTDETILEVVLAADHERHALMAEAETAEDPMRIAEIHIPKYSPIWPGSSPSATTSSTPTSGHRWSVPWSHSLAAHASSAAP